jgi:nucleotide-binding universal stress UspA family protein
MKSHRIVIAVPLEENLLQSLYDWGKEFDFSEVTAIHFLHVVKKNVTPLEFGLMESPDDATFREMAPTLEKFLKDEARNILPSDFDGEITFEVTKGYHPEEEVIELLTDFHATLIVIATRGIHGLESLFHHSFTEHMVKHAPCDVFVVRPRPHESASEVRSP